MTTIFTCCVHLHKISAMVLFVKYDETLLIWLRQDYFGRGVQRERNAQVVSAKSILQLKECISFVHHSSKDYHHHHHHHQALYNQALYICRIRTFYYVLFL